MKFCQNCGAELKEGATFCSNCGSPVSNSQPSNANVQSNQNYNQSNGSRPVVENRSLATWIIISLLTCGIGGIIWFINLVNDTNIVCNDEKSNQSGGMVFLLTLITCGIYGLIWFYQAGKRMESAGKKYGMQISDNSVVYLLLSLFGLGIVSYCLLQVDLNKFSNQ